MPFDTFLSLLGLAVAAAWTPGPNNALVASSGATFGLRRTVPHVLGIALGFPLMIFLVGLFLGELFQASALLRETLRWGGAALMLWVAWQIARSGGLGARGAAPRPFTFVEAAGFQWINPKAWAMAVGVTAQFISGAAPLVTAGIVAATFVAVGLLSASTWAGAGRILTRWLTTDDRLTWFNRVMAGLIVVSVVLLFRG
ncbi:LysE family translocator [Rhodovulum sp. YNF3179]|uniref:LysE family translocator n=1 Tax=Rhodovulum sp. YNF3179 TaxID=3425127 RepID=UPI003D3538A0